MVFWNLVKPYKGTNADGAQRPYKVYTYIKRWCDSFWAHVNLLYRIVSYRDLLTYS